MRGSRPDGRRHLGAQPALSDSLEELPTFFSFGPEVVTLDEFLDSGSLEAVEIATYISGAKIRSNIVGNMTHSPSALISFHSNMMPFFPGDLISTGTPGAGVLEPGAVAEARVDGIATLTNPVQAQDTVRR